MRLPIFSSEILINKQELIMELSDIIYTVLLLFMIFFFGFFTLSYFLSRTNRKNFENRIDILRSYAEPRDIIDAEKNYMTGYQGIYSNNSESIRNNYYNDRAHYRPNRQHYSSIRYFYN